MAESDVLYVPQLAVKLGRTEGAIRSAVARGADWLPPRMDMGRRIAWSRAVVDAFLLGRTQTAAPE